MRETLESVMDRSTCDKGPRFHDYGKRYAPFLEPLREQPINLLEVGIQFGCSARMWLEAFPNAHIYGVDIRKDHDLNHPRFHFEIGDQKDRKFWSHWAARNPRPHVIIDDGEHTVEASKATLESIWYHLRPGGLYSIEDCCVWWDKDFNPSADRGEWLRSLITDLNWRGSDYGGKPHPTPFSLTDFEQTVDSIHLSKHLCIIVKK